MGALPRNSPCYLAELAAMAADIGEAFAGPVDDQGEALLDGTTHRLDVIIPRWQRSTRSSNT